MATLNPFGLLGDDDAEDPTLLLAAQQKAAVSALTAGQPKKAPSQAQPAAKASAKLPSKPLPPAQAVRESRNDGQRGGRGGGRGAGRGRGGRGFGRDLADNENTFGNSNGFSGGYRASEEGDGGRAPSERRTYSGPHGVGVPVVVVVAASIMVKLLRVTVPVGRSIAAVELGVDQFLNFRETEEPTNEGVKNVESEKQSGEDDVVDASKDSSANEQEEKEPEEKEMTLEEYEKVLEEKRKALLALKSEERKVGLDKELEAMQLLSNKKNDDEVFIKLIRISKEAAEKAKKSVSINEFLKPAEGDKYYRAGGRGRGRGRGRGGFGGNNYNVEAPAIEDVGQFPSLVAK
ncbi:UNVERIFIED_CONTAM: RGG repeats nuclear RNA binding protein A [Sesamum radiatum]|uniref:RGG repeats nuclear RNA binding protein A n=1 Tax=Sesamum radiatum TaxID=300843 RepID=A0AAW2L130_SESRA